LLLLQLFLSLLLLLVVAAFALLVAAFAPLLSLMYGRQGTYCCGTYGQKIRLFLTVGQSQDKQISYLGSLRERLGAEITPRLTRPMYASGKLEAAHLTAHERLHPGHRVTNQPKEPARTGHSI